MATPQLSPGVLVREIDLTTGRVEGTVDTVGAIAGPFKIGPVEEVTRITTSQELLDNFGGPISTDRQYEYWLSASEYMGYGGVLSVVRADDDELLNSHAAVGVGTTTNVKIKNYDDYEFNHSTASTWYYATRNPGSWGNGVRVCQIDGLADQRLGVTTTSLAGAGITVGYGITAAIAATVAGVGISSAETGYVQAIITGVNTASSGQSTFDVKIVAKVDGSGTYSIVDYEPNNPLKSISIGQTSVVAITTNTLASPLNPTTVTITSSVDWYDEQTLGLDNSTVLWKSIAPRPRTSNFATSAGGRFDTINVAVVDDDGSVTGIQGNILEKFNGLSKASDSVFDAQNPTRNYFKSYISDNSEYVFAGTNASFAVDGTSGRPTTPRALGFSTNFTANTANSGVWGQNAKGIVFSGIGAVSYELNAGNDYGSAIQGGGFKATLGKLKTAYELFNNKDTAPADFLLMGPGCTTELETQAKANLLISIANSRKDCIACISPHRANVINVSNSTTQTTNVVNFFSALTSSSFAVFDSGYKYVYDRFNDTFRYLPCNADVAGLMVRTGVESFPWFSPAGIQRGNLNNAVKLAYNPNKDQRDTLYSSRINPIINQGAGPLLFGDKTALSYGSAFDRINVRRLFIVVEEAIEEASQASLFEVNDADTRETFVNTISPFLREIQTNRGIENFRVVCDESNNTPAIVDNNEFKADIFIQPTRSINYISLSFVATRAGIQFAESI